MDDIDSIFVFIKLGGEEGSLRSHQAASSFLLLDLQREKRGQATFLHLSLPPFLGLPLDLSVDFNPCSTPPPAARSCYRCEQQ